jgi:hypothetical protein
VSGESEKQKKHVCTFSTEKILRPQKISRRAPGTAPPPETNQNLISIAMNNTQPARLV